MSIILRVGSCPVVSIWESRNWGQISPWLRGTQCCTPDTEDINIYYIIQTRLETSYLADNFMTERNTILYTTGVGEGGGSKGYYFSDITIWITLHECEEIPNNIEKNNSCLTVFTILFRVFIFYIYAKYKYNKNVSLYSHQEIITKPNVPSQASRRPHLGGCKVRKTPEKSWWW